MILSPFARQRKRHRWHGWMDDWLALLGLMFERCRWCCCRGRSGGVWIDDRRITGRDTTEFSTDDWTRAVLLDMDVGGTDGWKEGPVSSRSDASWITTTLCSNHIFFNPNSSITSALLRRSLSVATWKLCGMAKTPEELVSYQAA